MTFPFSDDDRRLIAAVRSHLRYLKGQPMDYRTAETLGLMFGRLERRWLDSQWRTVDVSTGKPMKLDNAIQWWTTRTGQASQTGR